MTSQPIPIGGLVPLSGPSSIDGIEFRNGIILACEELNERGGILGRPLHPHFMDTGFQTAEEVMAAAARLIRNHSVHAIINGYNHGTQNSEYDTIADAEIIYINHNTLLQHHDTVLSDPDRYFGCFMANPAEYWYGPGFIRFISWLRDTGQWKPSSDRIAIISGSKPYSIVIAKAMVSSAAKFGWKIALGPKIVKTPTAEWRAVLQEARAVQPAVIANTHFYARDLASFQKQFMEEPINSLVYLQFGAMHRAFLDEAGAAATGIIVSSVTGLLRDEIGRKFSERFIYRFGETSTPQVACQCYNAVRHYAIAASIAGGTGGPGDRAQNKKVARSLIETPYRGVAGVINYHPSWQAAYAYPSQIEDPTLGMPHLFYQVQNTLSRLALVAPKPYDANKFILPPWLT